MENASRLPLTSTSPNGDSPRIALVGCGAIAEEYYLPALARHRNLLDRMILVDTNQDRAKQMAAQFNVTEFASDYRDALEKVDGAIVALPTHLHYPVSMEFVDQGRHVLCEKPLVESYDKAIQLVRRAEERKAVLASNYLQRLIPSFAKVKELLDQRAFGAPLSIRYLVGEEFRWPTKSGFYFNAPLSSRGILRDRGAHVIDHICWWLGAKPDLVSSQNDSFGGSETVAHVKFVHGSCTGDVLLNWVSAIPCKFSVTCEKGSIEGEVYDYHSLTLSPLNGKKQKIALKSKEKTKVDIAEKIVLNFVNAIAGREQVLVAGSDVLDSIAFVDECYEKVQRLDMPWYDVVEVSYVS